MKGHSDITMLRRRCRDYNREDDDKRFGMFHSILQKAGECAYIHGWDKTDIRDALQPLLEPKKDLPQQLVKKVKNAKPATDIQGICLSGGKGVKALIGTALKYHDGKYYKVVDEERKVVERLVGDRNTALAYIEATTFGTIGKEGLDLVQQPESERRSAFVEYLQEVVLTDHLQGIPAPFELYDGDEWCFHRCDVVPKDIPTPCFDEYGTRTTSWNLLKALIGGIACGEYRGKALGYIYGREGNEGKSTLLSIILETLFGRSFEAINENHITGTHGTASLRGKVVAFLPEVSNPYLLNNSTIKALCTKGERIPINPKYEPPESVVLDVSVIGVGNKRLVIEDVGHYLRRLLYFVMESPEVEREKEEVENDLRNEMAGILYKCLVAWEEHRTGSEIKPDKEMVKARKPLIQGSSNEQLLSAYFSLTGDDRNMVSLQQIKDHLRVNAGVPEHKHRHFITFLGQHKGITVKTLHNGTTHYHGLELGENLYPDEQEEEEDNVISIHHKLLR